MNKPSQSAPYPLRMPDEMRTKLEQLAHEGGRSLNAEIIKRLEWALMLAGEPQSKPNIPDISGDLPLTMAQDIAELAESAGVTFEEMLSRVFVAGIHKDAPQVLYMAIMPGATAKEMRQALEASKDVARPDATIVSEMIKRQRTQTPAQIAARYGIRGVAMGGKPGKTSAEK